MKKFELPEYRQLARNVIRMISKDMDELGIKWALGHGTLIGAVKANDIIPTCSDVDIDTFDLTDAQIYSLESILSKYLPFEDLRMYKGKHYLLAYRINRMRLDIHFWHSDGDWIYRAETYDSVPNGHVFYKLPRQLFDNLQSITFSKDNIMVNIPHNPEVYLDTMYGNRWKTESSGNGWHTKRDSPCLIPEKECPIYR